MIKVENYPNAYKEVYEILKYVPKEDLKRVPKKFMDMLEEKMNKNYKFSIDTSKDFIEEQELMIETRTILAYIFLNYWATEIQKEKINIKFKKDIEDAEKQKGDLYNVNIFKNKKQLKENSEKEQEHAMVIYKKENFITKIFNIIKNFFGMKH